MTPQDKEDRSHPNKRQPKTCLQLINEFDKRCHEDGRPVAELLVFDLPHHEIISHLTAPFKDPHSHRDETVAAEVTVYNPSRPILRNGKKYIFGRVETADSETNSHIMFFEETKNIWQLVNGAPHLHLQDPFHIDAIHGWQILGGVNIHPDPSNHANLIYETVFYRYKESVYELADSNGNLVKPFARGPQGMKDIRLVELTNGKIGVFTRPQGGKAKRGRIAYVEIDSLDKLSDHIPQAKIIEGMFDENEWGGANDLYLLNDGRIGVLGHIAHLEPTTSDIPHIPGYEGVRNYYAITFIFDPASHQFQDMKIIATAENLPTGCRIKPKIPSLGKVLFSGGLKRNEDGTAWLYAGINDTKAVRFRIQDPFLSTSEIPV